MFIQLHNANPMVEYAPFSARGPGGGIGRRGGFKIHC